MSRSFRVALGVSLVGATIIADESGLTVATNVTYHVSAEAGLATISCTP